MLKEDLQRGPFTLAMSSGFFGFFAHCGAVLALAEEGLTASKYTGSSAGAIVAAACAHGVGPSELKSILRELKRQDFWDPALGIGLLKGKKIEGLLREILQHKDRTAGLAISVYDIFARKTSSFSEGDVPRLVRASIAVPLMFHPVFHEGRVYWDGGILDKMALTGVDADERVLVHFLPGKRTSSVYERKKQLNLLNERQTAVVPLDLPAVGPYALQRGQEALERAYENMKRELERKS